MTTQTTNLLFQTNGANAAAPRSPSPDRLAESARANGAFGATLTRELAARQQPPQAAPQAAAAQQSKPAQQQSKPNAADKPATREPVREQASKAGAKPASHEGDAKPGKTAEAGAADGTEEAGAAEAAAQAAEAAAAATTPVTDMLAFMASLAKPATAALDAAAIPTDAAAAAGEPELTALESAFEQLGAAGATDDAASGAAAVTDELGKGVSPAAGVQRAPVDPNAAQGKALPESQQDGAQFQAQLRDSQQQAAPAAEEAPAPLAQLQAQATRMAEAVGSQAAVPGDRIPARVGSQAWDNQVSQRIVYMVGKEQAATLTLNPPDLGPVQIVLNVSNDQATVAFSAEQLEVRQALENALPRLREMMSESGIALNNATVDAGTRQQQDGERRAPGSQGANGNLAGNGTGAEAEAAVNEVAPRTRTVGLGERGMVDLFA
ncbi:flagellar hook-length control protein FliK [Massilia sp. HP4]|uniref:flagellar hook-length control protein FliK n=1 Tax=Massilia sp. HP4 TaxID=2562316 RepID=UPI0010C03A74|nr:flagellar hook-length control protein FliK [Massilia sp. HP4]